MARRQHVGETPATQLLRARDVAFTEHPYEYVEPTILDLPEIAINGARRGHLVGIDPPVCGALLGAQPLACALAE
jgi:prolyl-tRNA editing enzyme YbaK/EbsC (Cys-tRNA(Pro) deacylase)